VITHDTLPTLMGDASQLLQLFQNLIANAIKFRRDEAPRIEVGAQRVETGWRFTVRDNASASRRNTSTASSCCSSACTAACVPGHRHRLAICKKVVERHGGHIEVESTPGQGSTFSFTLRRGAEPMRLKLRLSVLLAVIGGLLVPRRSAAC